MCAIAPIPLPGVVVGDQFVLGRELGRGSIGVVFEAHQLGLKRRVAIKMLLPSALSGDGVEERFRSQVRAASFFTGPHTIRTYALGVHGEEEATVGLPFVATEFLEGETLEAYVERKGHLEQEEVMSLLRQALAGVAEAHDEGIVHRNLKPSNLFLSDGIEGRLLKVLDFGLTKAVFGQVGSMSSKVTMSGLAVGAPHYTPPEEATGEAVITAASDIYALGCVAYRLVSGGPPFGGRNRHEITLGHLSADIPRLSSNLVDELFADVIARAMSKDPGHRFQHADTFTAALDCVSRGDGEGLRQLDPVVESQASTDIGATAELRRLAIEEVEEAMREDDSYAMQDYGDAPPTLVEPVLGPTLQGDGEKDWKVNIDLGMNEGDEDSGPATIPLTREQVEEFEARVKAKLQENGSARVTEKKPS